MKKTYFRKVVQVAQLVAEPEPGFLKLKLIKEEAKIKCERSCTIRLFGVALSLSCLAGVEADFIKKRLIRFSRPYAPKKGWASSVRVFIDRVDLYAEGVRRGVAQSGQRICFGSTKSAESFNYPLSLTYISERARQTFRDFSSVSGSRDRSEIQYSITEHFINLSFYLDLRPISGYRLSGLISRHDWRAHWA
ncbi:hypothetical protein L195_g051536, partial [Trifolium pratense]